MIDYLTVKCELMEPRIGTGYTFSERSEFHGPRKYSINNNKGSLKVKLARSQRFLGSSENRTFPGKNAPAN